MRHTTLALAAAASSLLPLARAYWRMSSFEGEGLVIERADPIISPGVVSQHTHTIVGGSNFGLNSTYAEQSKSACTTCPPTMDLSNYWSPLLYFEYANGSFVDVPNFDFTVYYEQRYNPDNNTLVAFPPYFRMTAGNPTLRSYNASSLEQQAISFACLNYNAPASDYPQTPYIPPYDCPDGLRAQVYFPSCWDGVNLDSEDHQSHVAYPSLVDDGSCPDSHPVRMISIFFEVDFAVGDLNDLRPLAKNSTQPFVFAYGDPWGYGFHGDFSAGWIGDTLQTAVDTCTSDSGSASDCAAFGNLNTGDNGQSCRKTPDVDEVVWGGEVLDQLPGCNQVQYGPSPANLTVCPSSEQPQLFPNPQVYQNSTIVPPGAEVPSNVPVTDLTVTVSGSSWTYEGCYTDAMNNAPRTLPNQVTVSGDMTVEGCLAACGAAGYTYCGLEYASQCWGASSIGSSGTKSPYGECSDLCEGDDLEYCGAGNYLTLYQKS